MGRDAKSLDDHKREGTFRPDRHAGMLPAAKFDAMDVGECPKELLDAGREHWRWLLETIPDDVLAGADRYSLIALCRLWEKFVRYDAPHPEDGDERVASRRYNIAMNAFRSWASLARCFGLTPASRAKIKAPPPKEEPDDFDLMFGPNAPHRQPGYVEPEYE